jgi:hypothetical protein
MRSHALLRWCLVAVLAGCSGGSPRGRAADGHPATAAAAVAAAAPAAPAHMPPPESDYAPPTERGTFRDPGVFVDGQPVGVLRYGELPANLPVTWVTLDDGRKSRRYKIVDYLKTIGVNPAKVKAVHFYGGHRLSIVPGNLLRRYPNDVMFSFLQGTTGKPRPHYPSKDDFTVSKIDMISTMTIYVDKDPPRFDEKKRDLVDENGNPFAGVPYATAELRGGTRVYAGGLLVGAIKRNTLGGQADDHHSLAEWLEASGVDTSKYKTISFIADDQVVAELPASQAVDFAAPPKSSGQMVFFLPNAAPGAEPPKVAAVLLN